MTRAINNVQEANEIGIAFCFFLNISLQYSLTGLVTSTDGTRNHLQKFEGSPNQLGARVRQGSWIGLLSVS